MSARIDNRRRISLDPIFGHSGDTRVAASVTLAGMLFVLIGGTLLALGLPLKLTPQFPSHGSTAAPTSVRVVGATPSAGVPCEQQTWPYTDQGCLTRIEAKPRADATPVAAQASDKLSPLNATAPVVVGPPMQHDSTTGSAAQNEPAQASAPRVRDAVNAPPPDVIAADADDDAAQQRIVEPARRTRTNRHYGFHLRFGGFRPF